MMGLAAANHLRGHVRNCSNIVCNLVHHRAAGISELKAEPKVSELQVTIGGNEDIGTWQGGGGSGIYPPLSHKTPHSTLNLFLTPIH